MRELTAVKQAAFQVREQCGPTLKSSLRHICKVDKRDEKIFPSSGTLIQCTTELAGLGGNIGFVKNELAMQTNWSPHESLVCIKSHLSLLDLKVTEINRWHYFNIVS